ncbi:MAG: hypothetical protein ABI557_15100 [Aureliella sp.]
MKELARLWFRDDFPEFRESWNHHHPKNRFGLMNAQLYRHTPEYREFIHSASEYSGKSGNQLVESVILEYSRRDISNASLLRLMWVGDGGQGGNAFQQVHEKRIVCSDCNWQRDVQVRDAVIDLAELRAVPDTDQRKLCDFYRTDYGELLVSERARGVIQSISPEVRFGDVLNARNLAEPIRGLFQLRSAQRIQPILSQSPIDVEDFCPHTDAYKNVLFRVSAGSVGSEYYFAISGSLPGLAMTVEEYGRPPRYNPEVFVDQRMLLAFQQNKLKGYRVQPAHVATS